MRKKLKPRRWVALTLATVLALPLFSAGAVRAEANSFAPQALVEQNDYFQSRFPSLQGSHHVFDTLTYYELDYLLRNANTGANDNHVLLFGGSWQPETQAAIGYINEVAHEYGITSIRVFDTKLAGPDIAFDITDANSPYGDFTRRYVDLGARYLTNLNEHAAGLKGTLSAEYADIEVNGNVISPPGGAGVKEVEIVDAPFLFIYNKGNAGGPIVASLEGVSSAGSLQALQNGSGAEAYRTAIRGLFDSISAPGVKQARFTKLTNQEYIPGSYNEFKTAPSGNTPEAPDIFDAQDPAAVIDSVTLDELKFALEQDKTSAVFIGCAWCGDSQGIVKYLNQAANEYGVSKVYNWDFKLDGGVGGLTNYVIPTNPRYAWGETLNGNAVHTRTSNRDFTHIFTDFVNAYLPNLISENTKTQPPTASSRISGVNPVTGAQVDSARLQAPYIFVYDGRNTSESGDREPIIGHVELMGYWSATHNNEAARELKLSSLRSLFSRTEWAPTGLIGVAPTEAGASDGKIEGIERKSLEYRLKGSTTFLPVPENSANISNLATGTYEIRYASKDGIDSEDRTYSTVVRTPYAPGPIVEVVVPGIQQAPSGLVGLAPEVEGGTGSIVWFHDAEQKPLPAGLEFKPQNASADSYLPVADNAEAIFVEGSRYYEVRFRENTVDNVYLAPSAAATVYVPGFNELSPPTALQVIHPSTLENNDGQIAGLIAGAEYKPEYVLEFRKGTDAQAEFTPVPEQAIAEGRLTGLTPDTYSIRYAASGGLNASPAIELIVKANVAAPTGLVGIAPTTSGQSNGKITGTSIDQEYRLSTVALYQPVSGTEITDLAPGTYQVRFKENSVSLPSADTSVVVARYSPPSSGGGGGGTGGGDSGGGNVDPGTENDSEEELSNVVDTANGARADLKAELDEESGFAITLISEEIIDALLEKGQKAADEGKKAKVEIKVEDSDRTGSVQVTIPRSAFNEFAESYTGELVINVGYGSIAFDAVALRSIAASLDNGDISFILIQTELTEEGKEVLGDRPVYELLVYAGETYRSTFGGSEVSVSLPYTLKQGEDRNAIVVYHVTDEGELHLVKGYYNPNSRAVEFKTTHFSQYIIGHNKVEFTDVASSDWYAAAVTYLAARDITTGTGEGEFSPNARITRGQVIVLLLNAYGITPDAVGASNFSDAGNTYYTGYLAAAKRLGIANGYADNTFAPNQEITRQDLFTLLYRALDQLGELPEAQSGADSVSSYGDAGSISGYAAEAFKVFVEAGVVSGSDGKLNPRQETSRGQVAQVLFNLLSLQDRQ